MTRYDRCVSFCCGKYAGRGIAFFPRRNQSKPFSVENPSSAHVRPLSHLFPLVFFLLFTALTFFLPVQFSLLYAATEVTAHLCSPLPFLHGALSSLFFTKEARSSLPRDLIKLSLLSRSVRHFRWPASGNFLLLLRPGKAPFFSGRMDSSFFLEGIFSFGPSMRQTSFPAVFLLLPARLTYAPGVPFFFTQGIDPIFLVENGLT